MALDDIAYGWLKRVVLIANQKGGVGKSTLAAGFAVEVVRLGKHVLVLDADQQGNVSRSDLGADGDNGRGLAKTFQFGEPLEPERDIRPGLDLIPGGRDLAPVGMLAAASGGQINLAENLGARLAELCARERYDVVVIDSGPGDVAMLDALLRVARYLIVPSLPDSASLDGVEHLANRFLHAKRAGSPVELLGAVLFKVNPKATARNAAVLDEIHAMLEGSAPPFATTIRYVESAAIDQRNANLTAGELIEVLKDQKRSRLRALRDGVKVTRGGEGHLWSRDGATADLAADFTRLTNEILTRLVEHEAPAPAGAS